jgi:NADH-quinone oxidoreductase subunit B
MEVTRRRLGAGEIQELRSKQLTARQMLGGELERPPSDQEVEDGVLTTTLDRAARWAAANAIFPATFGLACCAIEIEPRWAIAMGACSSSMGVFNNYAIVPADKFMPVDVHVPGCPPRPEALMHGILKLRAMILARPDLGWRARYGGRGTEEFVESELAIEPVGGHGIGVSGGGRMGTSA